MSQAEASPGRFSDGTPYGHEAAPLVVGDTMYLVTPFPNIAYALDLSEAGAPIKWSFEPQPDADRRSARPAATRCYAAGPMPTAS